MDINQVLEIIRSGETEKVEFKQIVTRDIHKSIAAMANADGGHLILGVDEHGNIIGLDAKTSVDRITNSIQSIIPPPKIHINNMELDHRHILVIEIEKSSNLCSIGGVVYLRIGGGIRPLSIQEIMAASSEIGSLEWDRAPLVSIEEMQSNYVASFFSKRKELRGKEVKTPDRIRCLKSLGAIKDNKLTNAGVLFFAQTNEHLPQAKIRIVKMDGDEPKWSKEYEGPIWKIVESAYEDLLKEVNKLEIVVGTKRMVLGPFSPRVLREAIINAAVHRNYVIGSDIRIFLEDNSISIRNPGGLLPGVSLDDPEHVPRNPSLCNLMYEIGMIERYGYGIRMMRKEIENLKGFRLDFKVTPNRFEVIIERSVSLNLDQLDTKILGLLNEELKSGDLSKRTGSTKPTIIAHLKKLEQLGLIEKKGAGPQTKYRIK